MGNGKYVRISTSEGRTLSDIAGPFFRKLVKTGYEKIGYDYDVGGIIFQDPRTNYRITVVINNNPMSIEDNTDPSDCPLVREAEYMLFQRNVQDLADDAFRSNEDFDIDGE